MASTQYCNDRLSWHQEWLYSCSLSNKVFIKYFLFSSGYGSNWFSAHHHYIRSEQTINSDILESWFPVDSRVMYLWLVTRTFSLCVRYCWQAVWKIFQLWWIGRLLISRWVFVVSRLNYSLDPVSPATEHWLHQLRSQHILIRDNIVKKIYRTISWTQWPV